MGTERWGGYPLMGAFSSSLGHGDLGDISVGYGLKGDFLSSSVGKNFSAVRTSLAYVGNVGAISSSRLLETRELKQYAHMLRTWLNLFWWERWGTHIEAVSLTARSHVTNCTKPFTSHRSRSHRSRSHKPFTAAITAHIVAVHRSHSLKPCH